MIDFDIVFIHEFENVDKRFDFVTNINIYVDIISEALMLLSSDDTSCHKCDERCLVNEDEDRMDTTTIIDMNVKSALGAENLDAPLFR